MAIAINFPGGAGDGDNHTENGTKWVYDASTNSWTLVATGAESAFNFVGSVDVGLDVVIGAPNYVPPDVPKSGDQAIQQNGTSTASVAHSSWTGISGNTIENSTLLLYDGTNWNVLSTSVPGYPDLSLPDRQNGLDERYVMRIGDNMTGNLTLATDKIILDASGTGTFTGKVTAGSVESSGTGAFTGKVTAASTAQSDTGITVVTKDWLDTQIATTITSVTGSDGIDVVIASGDATIKVDLDSTSDDGLEITSAGKLSSSIATDSTLGSVIVGDGIDVATDGTISVPIATDSTLGSVIVGDGIDVDTDGTISVDANGASVEASPTPPTSPAPESGDLWFNTDDGRLYVYYTDADSSQWVDASPDSQVSPVTTGAGFPSAANSNENDLFYNTSDGRLYIYYKDTDSSQWVDASPLGTPELPAVYWDKSGTTLSPIDTGDSVDIGSGNITLNADGSAVYTGVVDIKDTGGLLVRNTEGYVTSPQTIDGGAYALAVAKSGEGFKAGFKSDGSLRLGFDVNSIETNSNITLDATSGNGTFLGDVLSQSPSPNKYTSIQQGGLDVQWFPDGTDTSIVDKLYVGRSQLNIFSAYAGGTGTAALRRDGDLYLGGDNINSEGIALRPNIALRGTDGSATFGNTDGKIQLAPNTRIQIGEVADTSDAPGVQIIKNSGGDTYQINYMVNNNYDNDVFTVTTRPGLSGTAGVRKIRLIGNGAAIFAGNVTSNGKVLTRNVELQLEADDDTKYTATTNEEGEQTLVYNGATLDVKDSLQKILAALVAIKTASETAGTLDDLKTAIAAATTNITEGGN